MTNCSICDDQIQGIEVTLESALEILKTNKSKVVIIDGERQLIRKKGKICERMNWKEIFSMVFTHLEFLWDEGAIDKYYQCPELGCAAEHISKKFVDFLQAETYKCVIIDPRNFKKDDDNFRFLYFENGWLQISKSDFDVRFLTYKQLDQLIWADQIIPCSIDVYPSNAEYAEP